MEKLINELIKLPNETPTVEFKHNNCEPQMIGRDISALANSAALHEKACSYMLWGIDDKTHEVVGTNFDLRVAKKGNQELESWLRMLLSKTADFEFHNVSVNNKRVGLLIIYRTTNQTVMFENIDYIRVGSYTKKLSDYPALQSQLWEKIHSYKYEEGFAKQNLELHDTLRLLDCQTYFDITGIPQPNEAENIAHYLLEEGIISRQDNGQYAVTNMGAILLARRLSDFPNIERKAMRVIQYRGKSRINMLKEDINEKGYVVGFEELMKIIEALIPGQEIINGARREKKTAYPVIAIREIVANALIHQDFSVTGTGPTVEIFENRIEVTNSGIPLVNIMRIIDNPPRSRNEKLAALMRRLKMCEELGTGWDKIVIACELYQLPAPHITSYEDSTRVTLYAEMPYSDISPRDKLWACYLHACIQSIQGERLTNSSLRKRFGLKDSSSAAISRLIKDAVFEQLIKPLDPETAPRYMKYMPWWEV